MKLSTLAATAAIAMASATSSYAFVDPFDLGGLPPSASFSNTVSGAFTDTWTFNLGSQSVVAASLTNVEVSFGGFSFGGIKNLTAWLNNTQLFGPNSTQTGDGVTTTLQVKSGSATLPAGVYSLVVSGTGVTGVSASYGGNIVAAPVTPVPEPETYAMLLAGLGVMGAIARRRKQNSV